MLQKLFMWFRRKLFCFYTGYNGFNVDFAMGYDLCMSHIRLLAQHGPAHFWVDQRKMITYARMIVDKCHKHGGSDI